MEKSLALEVKNLQIDYKIYEGTLKVVQKLDLFIEPKEKVGLIGEAGCGKTSVLKAIVSVLPIPPSIFSYDALNVFGKPINTKAGLANTRKNVSMVFQDPSSSLNPTLKINTQMQDILNGQFSGINKSDKKKLMVDALTSVSMPDPHRVLDSYPIQLSGGMRQRVSIAMALMKDSDLLIADEPTTALDVTIEEQILELIGKLASERNKSLLIVSHALGAIRKMTNRVYVMYAGDIVETAPTADLFTRPKHPYSIGLMEATPKLTGKGISDGIAGDLPDYLNPPKGCRFAARCSRMTKVCENEKPELKQFSEYALWQVACHHID